MAIMRVFSEVVHYYDLWYYGLIYESDVTSEEIAEVLAYGSSTKKIKKLGPIKGRKQAQKAVDAEFHKMFGTRAFRVIDGGAE